MRRLAFSVSALTIALLLALPSAVLAAETLDQSQESTAGGPTPIPDQSCLSQTFTAGLSGKLSSVSLFLGDFSSSLDLGVQLRDTVGGGPGSNTLASAVVDNDSVGATGEWVNIPFASPPDIVAGTEYAIVTSAAMADDGLWGWSRSAVVDPYAAGEAYFHPCTSPGSPTPFDLAFRTYVTETEPQPDGRIRRGWGDWIGGNIYNTTGAGQSRSGDAEPGHWRSFRLQVHNDGNVRDKFLIDASGAAVDGYRVKFMKHDDDITQRINQGTFQTRWLDPGERSTIEAWVKVQAGAAKGSQVGRLVTFSSLADPTKVDAVRFIVSRR